MNDRKEIPRGDAHSELAVGGDMKRHLKFHEKSSTGLVGLFNQGATCYLNSLLQALYMTPVFYRSITEWKFDKRLHGDEQYCIPYQLQLLFARLRLSERGAVDTTALTHSFHWTTADSFKQNDVQELMRVLFDAVQKFLSVNQPADTTSFVQQYYKGVYSNFVTCQTCNFSSERSEEFLDVALDVKSDLKTALEYFIEPEILTGGNQWKCPQCNVKVDAKKGIRFETLPPILTLQLKRFLYGANGRYKLDDEFKFPETLNMGPFIQGHSTMSYNLYAILMQAGSALGGHYYAYIKDHATGKWFDFNDANVSEMTLEKCLVQGAGNGKSGASGYLLLYALEDAMSTKENSIVPTIHPEIAKIVEEEDAAYSIEYKRFQEEQERIRAERALRELRVYRDTISGDCIDVKIDESESIGTVLKQIITLFDMKEDVSVRLRKFKQELNWMQDVYDDPDKTLLDYRVPKRETLVLEYAAEEDGSFAEYNRNVIPVFLVLADAQNAYTIVEENGDLNQLLNNYATDADASIVERKTELVRTVTPKINPANVFLKQVDLTLVPSGLKALFADVVPVERQRVILLKRTRLDVLNTDVRCLREYQVLPGEYVFIEDMKHDIVPPVVEITSDEEADEDVGTEEDGMEPLESKHVIEEEVDPDFARSHLLTAYEVLRCQISVSYNTPKPKTTTKLNPYGDRVEYTNKITLSKTATVTQLKEKLADRLKLDMNSFRLRKSERGAHIKGEHKTLQSHSIRNDGIVYIEFGQPMRVDDFTVDVYLYDPDKKKDKFFFLFQTVLRKSSRVHKIKTKLVALLNDKYSDQKGGNVYGIEHIRIQLKKLKNAQKIFLDKNTLRGSTLSLSDSTQICIRKLATPEDFTAEHRSISLQQYFPDRVEKKLGPKQETSIKQDWTVRKFREFISDLSGIPLEHVGIAKRKYQKFDDHEDLLREEHITLMIRPPLLAQDGDVINYKDRRVAKAEVKTAEGKSATTIKKKRATGRTTRPQPREKSMTIEVNLPPPTASPEQTAAEE